MHVYSLNHLFLFHCFTLSVSLSISLPPSLSLPLSHSRSLSPHLSGQTLLLLLNWLLLLPGENLVMSSR